ncbi:hypothetical protein ACE3MQ_24935 [Paenibacillus lentus]|uniref:hypothetical protein n=1 Tax=Paenibacillus lentus TaxID=1338368 RepID=UPI00365F7FDD
MPQKSGFFDSTADDMREYPAREFAEYFARFVGNGVFLGGTRLKVTASGQDANVNVELGYGWINGYMYSVYDEPLTMPIEPATTQDRIDRVILRLDTSAPVRAIRALVVQGLPSASPQPPALVRSGNIYDLSLAQIRVIANTTVVKPENITDERLNNQVCGIVTALIDQADTTSIFNQFQAWLNTKTAEYQQQWQDFMKSVQDEGFATTDYVDNRVLTGGYGVTTNSGNAYSVKPTPAPTALVEGLRVTVRINAANTGAATLNVNGLGAKNILKGNGNAVAAGNLKANSVYTLVYSGSAFILQGEGGGGTALASEIRSGKTANTDVGDVTGTFAVAAGNYPKDVSIFGVVGLLERMTTAEKQAIANAITSKNVPASANDSNAALANKIGQIVTGKRWASGSGMTVPGTRGNFEIRGLNFTPRVVIVHATYTSSFEPYYWFKLYDPDDMTLHGCTVEYYGRTFNFPTGDYRNPITIHPDGFSGNIGYGTISYEFNWKAYE